MGDTDEPGWLKGMDRADIALVMDGSRVERRAAAIRLMGWAWSEGWDACWEEVMVAAKMASAEPPAP